MDLLWPLTLAGFAGFINYIQRFAGKPEERPPWEWVPCGVKVFTGAFVGYLAQQLIGDRVKDQGYVNVAIAIAGYGGPLTLDVLWGAARDFFAAWASRATQKPPDQGPKN